MIVYEQAGRPADEAALRDHLIGRFTLLYGGDAPPTHCLEAVASAVALLCRSALNLRVVPDRLLDMLGSKALWSVGEGAAADQLLARCGHSAEDRAALRSLYGRGRADGPSLALCLLVAAGNVRPSRCTLTSAGPAWSVDVARRLDDGDVALMELGLCRRLSLILRVLSEVWDESQGAGVLELGGWSRLGGWADDPVKELSAAHCRRWLGHVASSRGWAAVPEVRQLNLGRGN